MKNLPYSEGSIFCVPLSDEQFVLGVVSRMNKGGKILLGHFFAPPVIAPPKADEIPPLASANALIVMKFGDLHLWKKKWPIVGKMVPWRRAAWPIPNFLKLDPILGSARLVTFCDDDLQTEVQVSSCPPDMKGYESPGLHGAVAVEIILRKKIFSVEDHNA